MKIVVVYVYPVPLGARYENYALRFLQSYNENPPGLEHESVVMLNGFRENSDLACMFSSLPRCTLVTHDNSGYDIGAFQKAAREIPCDLMVFFGASTFFNRPGWLLRMASAFHKHGPAQYGAMANRGDIAVRVWPHIRTTAFWMPPQLMNSYPQRIERPEQRHPFEHGPECLTSWLKRKGFTSWVITWSGDYLWQNWDDDPNGFQRGSQMSLLALDHLCESPYFPRPMR